MTDKPGGVNFDTTPPIQASQYDDTISKLVPGYEAIFQMAQAHLQARLTSPAEVLIVGAGSGKELITFGPLHPAWSLTGVDPSANMLAVARAKIAQYNLQERVKLFQGLVADLPDTPAFDAATCILVMHFLPDDGTKLALLSSIAARLKPGAEFILVDIFGGRDFVRELGPVWRLHGEQMGLPTETVQRLEKAQNEFHSISETRTLELLEQVGFEKARRFYTALVYCGWVATRKAS